MSENGQEKRETLAAIVALMRSGKLSATVECENCGDEQEQRFTFNGLADRIESAWERERSEIEANALAVGGIVEAARHKPVGNAAAIYAALVKIHDLTNALGEECGVDPVEIRDLAREALAKPARNCDVYKTPDDCMMAFESYVRDHGKLGFINPFTEVVKWLLAPAAERKGEGDGR